MNLNQLRYFISVAELKNFTRAAEQNFISQTAISQQIKTLERDIGVELLARDKHHVELTAAGKVYLNEARRVIQIADDAVRLTRMASSGVQGEITIGFVTGYGKGDLAEHLRTFHEAFPNVDIKLQRNNSSVVLNNVAKGTCDVAFVVSSHVHDKTALTSKLTRKYMTSYPIMAVLPASHALAECDSITYADLADENFIMMDPVDQPREQMQEALLIYQRAGYIPNIVAADSEDETVMLMVAAGVGVAIIPEYITRHYAGDKTLVVRPIIKDDGTSETLDFDALWSAENANPALEHFLKVLE